MTIKRSSDDCWVQYPHSSRGIASIPKKVLRILGRGAQNLRALGEIEPEDQEKLVAAGLSITL